MAGTDDAGVRISISVIFYVYLRLCTPRQYLRGTSVAKVRETIGKHDCNVVNVTDNEEV
jgi:hypothetical protein